jgi:hypothetical protein
MKKPSSSKKRNLKSRTLKTRWAKRRPKQELDLSLRFGRRLFVRHHDGFVDQGKGHQPTVGTAGELRLCEIEKPCAPLSPQHDIGVLCCHSLLVHAAEEAVRHIVLDPQHEVLGLAAGKKLALDPINAANTTIEVTANHTPPESRTDIESVVAVLRGDEHV